MSKLLSHLILFLLAFSNSNRGDLDRDNVRIPEATLTTTMEGKRDVTEIDRSRGEGASGACT
jgi:hypothetical protein